MKIKKAFYKTQMGGNCFAVDIHFDNGYSVQVGKTVYQLTNRRAPKGHPDSLYHKPNRMARREPKRVQFNQSIGEGILK